MVEEKLIAVANALEQIGTHIDPGERALHEQFAGLDLRLEGLAQQMNCSPRTLRRHLHDLGCSYQELLDELRFEQAKQMLCEDQLPIYQIAEALGFSETASFRHAFQRWSGLAPSDFRR